MLIWPRSMSPGVKSTNLYGPVPTGLRLFGASRDFAPLYASNRCFGMIRPRVLTNGSAQNGDAFGYSTRTVYGSMADTLMSLYVPIVTAAVAGSAAYSQLNTTSAEVNGLPSCHWTSFLSFQTIVLPSFDTPP